MNWKKSAIEDLRKYPLQREALTNIRERIGALETIYRSAKTANLSADPVKGGGNRVEDALLNNIVERERLKATYRATERLVKLVERGLAGLSDEERLVLQRFYIAPARGSVEALMSELHVEKTRVYERKDEALYLFTVFQYGIIDY